MIVSKKFFYIYKFFFRKFEIWKILIVFIFSLFIFGYLVKVETNSTSKFGVFSKIAYEITHIPTRLKQIFSDETRYPLIAKKLTEYDNKNYINKEGLSKYKSLLVLSRFDGDIKKNIIEIYNLENFKVLKKVEIDLEEIFSKVLKDNIKETIDIKRTRVFHPYVKKDGNIIFHVGNSRLFEIDLCGNLVNNTFGDLQFHHSIESTSDENFFWVPIYYTSENMPINLKQNLSESEIKSGFKFNGIAKLNKNLEVVYLKSIYEILDKNQQVGEIFFNNSDWDHLNDIEVAKYNGEFFLKDDLFLSLRDANQIVHYRPSKNKVIRSIVGPFSKQHDVDIISKKEISIFNNNLIPKKNKSSELIIYNLETSQFKKMYNNLLKAINFHTYTEGLSDYLGNYNFMLEETNQGRIIIVNNNNELDLQYVNMANNGKKFLVTWSRIISEIEKITLIKNKIENLKCDT
jgi:hypothetical protein